MQNFQLAQAFYQTGKRKMFRLPGWQQFPDKSNGIKVWLILNWGNILWLIRF